MGIPICHPVTETKISRYLSCGRKHRCHGFREIYRPLLFGKVKANGTTFA